MLRSLSIRNFAIIDRLDIELAPGLNVMTGETGAGKSIIVGALTVILGGRAGIEMVRAGSERATIDAVFDLEGTQNLSSLVEQLGFDLDGDLLLLSRDISVNGKSNARIGGRPATVSQLRDIGEGLVDLHGQHEHQSLLAVSRHIDILDEWGGREIAALRNEIADYYHRLSLLKSDRDGLASDATERARLTELYQFQVNEIRKADLQPGEEEQIRNEARRLANAQKLSESTASVAAGLSDDNGGILAHLAQLSGELSAASALDERLATLAESLQNARYDLEEAARDLVRYRDEIEFNPGRLQQLEDRLDLINGLKRKYGDTIDLILEYASHTEAQLQGLESSCERRAELDAQIGELTLKLDAMCKDLTACRKRIAHEFSHAVISELEDLAMEKTRFEVLVEAQPPGPTGADRIEFLIAPNPGEPLRPLARIASGGEISRVMLAIKSAMARQEPLPTMVFDEIDSGVGGRTGSVLGAKLSALARYAQVLCITHLPQIASQSANHLRIEKRVDGDRTLVRVEQMSPEDRVEELARMLGGPETADTAIQHARELLHAR